MKKLQFLAAICGVLPAFVAVAEGSRVLDEARVLNSEAIYQTVQVNKPVQRCWEEQVRVSSGSGYESATPKIVGALVGAAVGNEFGKGRGNDLATVAGAILGGSIGRDVQANSTANRQSDQVVYEERCETVDRYLPEERLVGYDVTYRYNGIVYSAVTDYEPGEVIAVSVSVVPAQAP